MRRFTGVLLLVSLAAVIGCLPLSQQPTIDVIGTISGAVLDKAIPDRETVDRGDPAKVTFHTIPPTIPDPLHVGDNVWVALKPFLKPWT